MEQPWEDGDEKNGGKIFKKYCQWCHNIEANAKSVLGPNLWNVYEGDCGRADFHYSKALKNKPLKWNSSNLFEYIKNPKGTKKVYPKIKDEQSLRDLIAFLKTKKDPENSPHSS